MQVPIAVEYEPLTSFQCETLKKYVVSTLDTFLWGTYGPKGARQSLVEKPLTQLETSHLENILITQPQITNEYAAAILMILKQRYSAVTPTVTAITEG